MFDSFVMSDYYDIVLLQEFLANYCSTHPNMFLMSEVHMKKSHFSKDMSAFNSAGLLRYIQPTMAEFRHCIEKYKDEPVPPMVRSFNVLEFYTYFSTILYLKGADPFYESSDSENDDDRDPPFSSSKRPRYEVNLTTSSVTPVNTSTVSDVTRPANPAQGSRGTRRPIDGEDQVFLYIVYVYLELVTADS